MPDHRRRSCIEIVVHEFIRAFLRDLFAFSQPIEVALELDVVRPTAIHNVEVVVIHPCCTDTRARTHCHRELIEASTNFVLSGS